jgi:hypothetical protein
MPTPDAVVGHVLIACSVDRYGGIVLPNPIRVPEVDARLVGHIELTVDVRHDLPDPR